MLQTFPGTEKKTTVHATETNINGGFLTNYEGAEAPHPLTHGWLNARKTHRAQASPSKKRKNSETDNRPGDSEYPRERKKTTMAHIAAQLSDSLAAIETLTEALNTAFNAIDDTAGAQLFGGDGNDDDGNPLPGPENLNQLRDALQEAPAVIGTARAVITDQANNRAEALKLTPMTIICAQDADHDQNEVPEMRMYRLEDFKGDREKCTKDSYVCLDWLNRVMRLGDTRNLTHNAITRLIQLHATHEAGRTVRNAVADGKTLTQIVVDLEVNYSGLMLPDLALEKCKSMQRRDSEHIRAFGERIRLMAEMATRNRPNMQAASLELARDSFFVALRPSLKNELQAKLTDRRRQGEGDPSFTEIVNEAHGIDEIRSTSEKNFRARKNGNGGTVNRTALDDEAFSHNPEWSNDDLDDDEDDDEDNLQEALRLVNRFTSKKRGTGYTRGNFRGRGRGTTTQANTTGRSQTYTGRTLAANEFEELDDSGEFLTLHYVKTDAKGGQRLRVSDLNVLPHECARCGIAGHRTVGPDANKCPLRMYITQAEPCRACNKGGHDAKVCPRKPNLEKN